MVNTSDNTNIWSVNSSTTSHPTITEHFLKKRAFCDASTYPDIPVKTTLITSRSSGSELTTDMGIGAQASELSILGDIPDIADKINNKETLVNDKITAQINSIYTKMEETVLKSNFVGDVVTSDANHSQFKDVAFNKYIKTLPGSEVEQARKKYNQSRSLPLSANDIFIKDYSEFKVQNATRGEKLLALEKYIVILSEPPPESKKARKALEKEVTRLMARFNKSSDKIPDGALKILRAGILQDIKSQKSIYNAVEGSLHNRFVSFTNKVQASSAINNINIASKELEDKISSTWKKSELFKPLVAKPGKKINAAYLTTKTKISIPLSSVIGKFTKKVKGEVIEYRNSLEKNHANPAPNTKGSVKPSNFSNLQTKTYSFGKKVQPKIKNVASKIHSSSLFKASAKVTKTVLLSPVIMNAGKHVLRFSPVVGAFVLIYDTYSVATGIYDWSEDVYSGTNSTYNPVKTNILKKYIQFSEDELQADCVKEGWLSETGGLNLTNTKGQDTGSSEDNMYGQINKFATSMHIKVLINNTNSQKEISALQALYISKIDEEKLALGYQTNNYKTADNMENSYGNSDIQRYMVKGPVDLGVGDGDIEDKVYPTYDELLEQYKTENQAIFASKDVIKQIQSAVDNDVFHSPKLEAANANQIKALLMQSQWNLEDKTYLQDLLIRKTLSEDIRGYILDTSLVESRADYVMIADGAENKKGWVDTDPFYGVTQGTLIDKEQMSLDSNSIDIKAIISESDWNEMDKKWLQDLLKKKLMEEGILSNLSLPEAKRELISQMVNNHIDQQKILQDKTDRLIDLRAQGKKFQGLKGRSGAAKRITTQRLQVKIAKSMISIKASDIYLSDNPPAPSISGDGSYNNMFIAADKDKKSPPQDHFSLKLNNLTTNLNQVIKARNTSNEDLFKEVVDKEWVMETWFGYDIIDVDKLIKNATTSHIEVIISQLKLTTSDQKLAHSIHREKSKVEFTAQRLAHKEDEGQKPTQGSSYLSFIGKTKRPANSKQGGQNIKPTSNEKSRPQ